MTKKNPIERWELNKKSLRASINAKCYDCSGHNYKEVRECTISNCPLFEVRPNKA